MNTFLRREIRLNEEPAEEETQLDEDSVCNILFRKYYPKGLVMILIT